MGAVTARWSLSGLIGVIQMCRTEHPIVQVACVAARKWTLDVEWSGIVGLARGASSTGWRRISGGPIRRAEETLRQRTLLQPEVSK